jgi:hypothetical protein
MRGGWVSFTAKPSLRKNEMPYGRNADRLLATGVIVLGGCFAALVIWLVLMAA